MDVRLSALKKMDGEWMCRETAEEEESLFFSQI
jgi:hypothetical protein